MQIHVSRRLAVLSVVLITFISFRSYAADALNPGDLDTSFQIGNGGNQPIQTLAINQTNGVMYIGGRFSRYNTNDVRRFAVLNPNGSLDLTWWNQIKDFNQPGANDIVNIVALDNQGRVLVGGRFGTFFGRAIRHLVRLNPDGTLDETFNNGGISGFGPNDEVTSIYVTGDDKVLIAGQFTSYNDGTQTLTRNQMLRLNADMSLDTSFDPGLGAETTSGSPIGTIVQQPDGKILIGGEFERFQNTAVGRIARLNTDGSLDTAFNPGGQGLSSGNIREIELLSDGRIIAVGNIVSYNGTATDNFIRLSGTGALDTSFQPNVSAQIRSVEVQPDGRYLIVGDFRTVGSANSARPAAARINTDGTPDLTFNGGTATFRTPEDPNRLDAVNASMLDPNNFLVLVGDFTHWNMIENVNYITRIATDNVVVSPPPTITNQPASQAICIGQSGTFTVGASGDAPLTYQWSKNGVAISGATNATYTIAAVTAGDAGNYTVVVSNNGGSTTSSTATLTPDNPPTITTQPQATTVDSGSTLTLSVIASGTGPLTYQWSKNGVAIGGATASSYTVASTATGDAGSYTVAVSNACGTTTSSSAAVTVNVPNQPPSITTQPQPSSLTVCVGTNVSYTVAATGTAPLTYQWFRNGVSLNGATSATLTLASVTTADAGSITVTVSNGLGSATSSAVTLTVLAPPSITTQPQSTTVSTGGSFTLSVGVSGTFPFTYQWFKNGVTIGGATASTYTVGSAATGDAGSYTVTVSNACGSTASVGASVTVNDPMPPNIVGHPLPQSVKVGSSAFFNVVVLGATPFTYQWRKDGTNLNGATSQTLLLTGVSESNAGNYSVFVSNADGSATSTNALLTILFPPSITTQPQATTVIQGNTLNLSVAATGTAPFTYQWKLNGVNVAGANSATLSIPTIQAAQAGTYTVEVSNGCGAVTSQGAVVTVGVPPTINGGGQPQSLTVCTGTNVTFSVAAGGTTPLTYQWSFNGVPIGGATGATYSIPTVSTANGGNYTVRINNAHGSVTSSTAALTVLTPPGITVQPPPTTVLQGNSLALSVSASGSAPLSYQWKLNGVNVAGANSATLSIPNIQSSQAGAYTVEVSNACGSVTSTGAPVTVGIPPTINSGGQPQSLTVCTGTNVSFTVAANGTAPFTYQWSFNGSPIGGATAATYTIPIVSTVNAGAYTVQVNNAHGGISSSAATLTVLTPPTITAQPQATTVIQGNTLNLNVAATGSSPFTYQWKLNGAVIVGATAANLTITNLQSFHGGTYTVDVGNVCGTVTSAGAQVTVGIPPTIIGNPQPQVVLAGSTSTFTVSHGGDGPCAYQWLKNGLAIGGATNQTLSILNSQDSDEGLFSVVVTCAFGAVTSQAASLTVNNPPSIITPPQSQSALAGSGVVFSVVATGDPTLTYQWKKNGADLPGQTGASLTLSNVQDADEGNYTVMVMNPFGVTSSAATLTVNNPPAIVGQPQDQDVINGNPASFIVTVTGDGPCAFQWMKNGVNIPGATNQAFSIVSTRETDEALYLVRVTCPFGTVTSNPATLTVRQPPVVITSPVDQSVIAGSTAVFGVLGGGDPTLSYQWFRNGALIAGATNTIHAVTNAQDSDEAIYSAQAKNPYGTATSTGATLTVNNPPAITTQPQPQVVLQGTTASFSVTVSGDGPCSFQWLKNGAIISGATNQTLVINNSRGGDEANYSVIITCPFGAITSNQASLTVNEPPIIITNPVDRTVFAGTTTTFSVVAGGDPTLVFQWKKNGAPIAGATNSTLVIVNAQEADEANYSADVTNPFGSASSLTASLTVNTGPAITGHPRPLTVLQGAPASFTVTVSGDGPCSFQWLKNGVLIAGATNQALSFASSQPGDEADYSVIVTCAFGSATSNPARLTVNEPPFIIVPPADQSIIAGSTASFAVTAGGDPTLVYQWFRNGVTLTNATNTTLFIFNAQDADEGAYAVRISNPFGTAFSTNATLTVNNPPTITGQPQPLAVIEGNAASFSVGVNADGFCSYQWLKNGVIIAGATNQALSIINSRQTDEANYSVVITCTFGTVTSRTAFLTVHKPPFIISNPRDQSVLAGSSASFSVFAGGDPTITYQWMKNGVDLPGETNTFLIVANAQDADEGNYSARAVNPYGTATSALATLTVNNPPQITGQPQPQEVIVGQTAVFSVTAGGDGPCAYQWRFNGVNVSSTSGSTLTITNAQVFQQGSYSVVITCPFGSVTSQDATLTVRTPPTIVVHPVSQTIVEGASVILTSSAVGDPVLSYQWSFNSVVLPGETNTFLVRNNINTNQTGNYSVTVTNLYGAAMSTNALVSVKAAPVITSQPQPQSVIVGQPASFSVTVVGDGPCAYQWRRDGVNISGAVQSTYTIASSQLSDQALYSVVITCPFGTVTSQNAQLTVNEPPRITLDPVSQTVVEGTNVTFTSAAVGTPTLFYQWRKNGVDIPGATGPTLLLVGVTTNDFGQYALYVTNAFGNDISANAMLDVRPMPAIVSQPQPRTVVAGNSASFSVTVSGDGPCAYQWRRNGANINGATASTYTILSAQLSDQANYSVVVTCPFGTVTSQDATLTVVETPRIVFNPISEIVQAGTNAVISVLAEGTEVLNYQWHYQPGFSGVLNGTPVAGGDFATLHLRNVTTNLTGVYYCVVQNAYGSTTSRHATVTVVDPNDLNSGGGGANPTQRTVITPTVNTGAGLITFQFGTIDGQPATAQGAASIVVQSSTDLREWVNLPTTVSIVNGLYQVTFNDPAALTHRYYRIRYQ